MEETSGFLRGRTAAVPRTESDGRHFPGGQGGPATRGAVASGNPRPCGVRQEALPRPQPGVARGKAYRETWSKDGGSVELEWGFSPPLAPGRAAEPLRGKAVRLTIGQGSVAIAFSGLDAADEPGSARLQEGGRRPGGPRQHLPREGEDHEPLLHLLDRREGAREGRPRQPAPIGGETLRRLISGNMMNLYIVIMALSFGSLLRARQLRDIRRAGNPARGALLLRQDRPPGRQGPPDPREAQGHDSVRARLDRDERGGREVREEHRRRDKRPARGQDLAETRSTDRMRARPSRKSSRNRGSSPRRRRSRSSRGTSTTLSKASPTASGSRSRR